MLKSIKLVNLLVTSEDIFRSEKPVEILKNIENYCSNPILSFHLSNLWFRQNLVIYANEKMYLNYEFWTFRALRQYLVYVLKIEQQKEVITFDCFENVIIPYVLTINRNYKKVKIIEELSTMVVERVFVKGVSTQLKLQVNQNLQSNIKRVLKDQSAGILEKLINLISDKSIVEFR